MAARRLTPGGHKSMRSTHESIVERLAAEAIRRGADLLDVEYKDGYEDVVAATGGVGHAIARFRSSSPEAVTLREELHRIARESIVSPLTDLSMSCEAASMRASVRTRSECSCAASNSTLNKPATRGKRC